MPIFVKKPISTKVYELVPEGQHQAVLTVHDLGIKNTAYGPKEKVLFRWTIAQRDKDGFRLSAAEFFNKVFGPKANLTEACIDLTGEDPSGDPTFDLESLNGINRLIIVKHSAPNAEGKRFANIKARLDVPKDAPQLPAVDPQAPNQNAKMNPTAAKPSASSTNPSAITAANPITDQDVAFA